MFHRVPLVRTSLRTSIRFALDPHGVAGTAEGEDLNSYTGSEPLLRLGSEPLLRLGTGSSVKPDAVAEAEQRIGGVEGHVGSALLDRPG